MTSYLAVARRKWGPRALWVEGQGRYATLAHCGGLTVELHRTQAEAQQALDVINATGCGHRCSRNHELVVLPEEGPSGQTR